MANSKNWPFKPLLGSQQAINNHPIKKRTVPHPKGWGCCLFRSG